MTDREPERRTAVIDLGSNSFRLVVFTAVAGSWWKRTDEIHEPVRVGAGLDRSGSLHEKPMARALRTIEMYAHFCRASGLHASHQQWVATSAIRDAANREEFLARARELAGVDVRVLASEEEAFYGYVAAVNSTTLADGVVLDLGGGSLQLVGVEDRRPAHRNSWALGAVRMTERFLSEDDAGKKQLKALRAHVLKTLDGALDGAGERIVGLGGTVRNLAAAAQVAAALPSMGVQGFALERAALDALVEELASMPAAERGSVPGIKPQRGDVILAGAATVQAVMDTGSFGALEVTEAGLREGIFLAGHLAPADPPLLDDVRRASVLNLAAQYETDPAHVRHVIRLTLEMWDALAAAGLHPGEPAERELLWAAATLHDIGMTLDYDDHHKHSRYLILNAGLGGYTPREVALIAQMARYHRKGNPGFGELEPLMGDGDAERLERGAALLRLAEGLERSRDQIVRATRIAVEDDHVLLQLTSDGDPTMAAWAGRRHGECFERAFGRELRVEA